MIQVTDAQKQKIKTNALAHPDREVCGLILNTGAIISCKNTHKDPRNHFKISTNQYIKYEPLVAGIYHSHVNDVPNFTANDVDLVYKIEKPLVLYTLTRNEFKIADLSDDVPLLDREFLYGVYDCYSLVKAYYWQRYGIELGRYPRSGDTAKWDESSFKLVDLNFAKEGFQVVDAEPRAGDLLGMSMGANNLYINHLAVMVDDTTFMHQLANQRSRLDVWGHPWREYTIKVLRHRLV